MKPRFNLIKMDRIYVRNLRNFVKNTDIVENNGKSNSREMVSILTFL